MLGDNLVKSQIIELKVQEEFLRYGFDISVPAFNTSRYDLLVDTGKELLKIQTKKSIGIDDGAFQFHCTSQNVNANTNKARHKYTSDEVDYFATVWKDKVYLVPLEETANQKTMRYKADKCNHNFENCEKYLAENVLSSYKRISDDELYNYTVQNQQHHYCLDCGQEIGKTSKYCLCCSSKHQRTKERPPRQELKQLIRTESFLQIGKQFGVTDNAIRKWCKAENLPFRKSDINSISDERWEEI